MMQREGRSTAAPSLCTPIPGYTKFNEKEASPAYLQAHLCWNHFNPSGSFLDWKMLARKRFFRVHSPVSLAS
jgi:hypothetical protein